MSEVIFYYLRDNELNKNDKCAKKGQPFGVVAMHLNEDGTINRGVSICSPCDKFDKKTGRGIALARLMECENSKVSRSFGIYLGEPKNMNIVNVPFLKCYYYRVNPTESEHRMLYKPE